MAVQDRFTRRTLAAFVAGALAVGLIGLYTGGVATATHEPAQKVAAAGTDIDQVNDNTVVLSETARVASTQDLVLQVTAECSILTGLITGDNEIPGPPIGQASDAAFSFGSVRLQVTIDGTPVQVSTTPADEAGPNQGDAADTGVGADGNQPGEVTFCNRAYQRTVTADFAEQDNAIDEERDFIRTRAANAFNWLALDVGFNYDDPAILGNNVVQIQVLADFDEQPGACNRTGVPDNDPNPISATCADAFIGSRTLIAEPTNASVHEEVNPTGGDGS
jgi:hypothetical protein